MATITINTLEVPAIARNQRIYTNGTVGSSSSVSSGSGGGGTGVSGSSGTSGTAGTIGTIGTSGSSGIGANGTSGSSGANGTSGTSGNSGTSGTSGLLPGIGSIYQVVYRDTGASYGYNTNSGLVYNTTTPALTVTGTITATSDVTAYSDARIKANVVNTDKVLNKLMKLRIVDYTRTDINNEKIHTGIIAQELRDFFPDYVIGDEKIEMLSVNYAGLVSICIKAIQEQQIEIIKLQQLNERNK